MVTDSCAATPIIAKVVLISERTRSMQIASGFSKWNHFKPGERFKRAIRSACARYMYAVGHGFYRWAERTS
jgi:hypothetical protein